MRFIYGFSLVAVLALVSGCSKGVATNKASVSALSAVKRSPTPESVTLYSRYQDENGSVLTAEASKDAYRKACFSFRWMNQNEAITRNNWDVLFEARGSMLKEALEAIEQDSPYDYFRVETVVDDFSSIVDLGETHCSQIESEYPENKYQYPNLWISYAKNLNGRVIEKRSATAKVVEGHCYFVANSDSDGNSMAIFHVSKLVPHYSVTLDEMDLLSFKKFNP